MKSFLSTKNCLNLFNRYFLITVPNLMKFIVYKGNELNKNVQVSTITNFKLEQD